MNELGLDRSWPYVEDQKNQDYEYQKSLKAQIFGFCKIEVQHSDNGQKVLRVCPFKKEGGNGNVEAIYQRQSFSLLVDLSKYCCIDFSSLFNCCQQPKQVYQLFLSASQHLMWVNKNQVIVQSLFNRLLQFYEDNQLTKEQMIHLFTSSYCFRGFFGNKYQSKKVAAFAYDFINYEMKSEEENNSEKQSDSIGTEGFDVKKPILPKVKSSYKKEADILLPYSKRLEISSLQTWCEKVLACASKRSKNGRLRSSR